MLHRKSAAVLAVLKWPVAVLCLAYLPATAWAMWLQLRAITAAIHGLWPVAAGLLASLALWAAVLRHTRVSFLSTLEHEITHCLFAWITFNRFFSLRATLRSGGSIQFEGTTNWLIQTAPYFFPTATALLLAVAGLVDPRWTIWMYGLIGASIGYHLVSTWAEAHHQQTDLREAGLLFSVMFLPTANLLCYALVLAYLRAGSAGAVAVFRLLAHSPFSPLRLLA